MKLASWHPVHLEGFSRASKWGREKGDRKGKWRRKGVKQTGKEKWKRVLGKK